MDTLWRTALWKQFGAAIDALDNALIACPDTVWSQPVWHDSSVPSERTAFWYVAYHALFWLDLYLFGSEEGFAPLAPFTLVEQDDAVGTLPERAYSRKELRAYLASLRAKCRATIESMTDERASQPVHFDWLEGAEVVTYAELQIYSMRHIQEHATQLNLVLGEHGVPAEQIDWVARAKGDTGEG
ncbi:MAG TPA: DinB family protein [Ktedonobacterales bacterium]|nr:DinB family protein [Ktedonobacterales bacterium]